MEKKTDFNTDLLQKQLILQGFSLEEITYQDFYIAHRGALKDLWYKTVADQYQYATFQVIEDKYLTNRWLAKQGISVSPSKVIVVDANWLNSLKTAAMEIGFPLVLKPRALSHGDLIFSEITTEGELTQIAKIYADALFGQSVILEKHFAGEEYRFFVTRLGKIAIVHREPAFVVGDGILSIESLVEKENKRRMNPRVNCLCRIKIDDVAVLYLKKQRLTLSTVPKKSEKIYFRRTSNVSMGGMCRECSHSVHKSFYPLAQKILSSFPKVPVLGIDIITRDISQKVTSDTYVVCEVNAMPGLSLHTHPGEGESISVDTWLVEATYGS